MPAPAIVTVILCGVVLIITALALVRIILHLGHVRKTLGTIAVGCQVVAYQTSTVPAVIASVNRDLKPVRDFCETV